MITRFHKICCVFILISGWIHGVLAQEVSIPDPDLASALRLEFSLPADAAITKQMMQELTELNAQRARISDLTGLEHAKNLTNLNLFGNQINDITLLAKLTELEILSLGSNQITDISALTDLTRLRVLSLGSNQITDISALAGLTEINLLFLESNQIIDIKPLEKLTNLDRLSLWSNQITDISALASLTQLTELYLVSNEIENIAPLAALTNLSVLWLAENQIRDISPLSNLTQLVDLWLGMNQINGVQSLSGLMNLERLSLESNQIRIVTPLKSLTQLERLNLSSNQIESIKPLIELPNLETFSIADNPISGVFQIHQMIAEGVTVDYETSVPNDSQVVLTRAVFNEVRNASDDRDDWIELKNISNTDIHLQAWEISILTRRNDIVDAELDIVTFPDWTLPAGEILLITNTDPSETTLLRGQNIRTPEIKRGAQHNYLVANKLKLPSTPYLLILRSALDKNKTQEAIEDVAGNYFRDDLTAEQPLTQGTAWERAIIREVGYVTEAWEASGYKAGIGYQPTAPKTASHGTPGYANDAVLSRSTIGQISISEVMFTDNIGNRSVPQWIEFYNNSHTEAVNLTGWQLTIESRHGKRHRHFDFTLKALNVLPNQTMLLVTGIDQKSDNIPGTRVYNFAVHHLLELLINFPGSKLLSSGGFFLQLSTPDGVIVDTVGNLDGDSQTQDEPMWDYLLGKRSAVRVVPCLGVIIIRIGCRL